MFFLQKYCNMRGAWFVPTIPVFDYTKFACSDNVVNEYIVNTQPQRNTF